MTPGQLGTPAVEAVGLVRGYGPVRALRGVDLRLEHGERVAVFGPNGAGKTTLLMVLATLVAPAAGTFRLFGCSHTATPAVRRRIGVVAHRTYLDDVLTAGENLAFYARLYDVPRAEHRIREVLDLVGLGHRRRDPVGSLSRGMQQRVALARAVLHDPDLLLLDEPDTGLDVAGVDALVRAVERPGAPRTLVVASHHPDRAARLAGRALHMAAGRIVHADTADPSLGPHLGAPVLAGARA